MATFIRSAGLSGVTAVENSFITDYMPKASGEHVKVYIFGLMRCMSAEDIPCPFTDEELAEAYSYWQSTGLVRVISSDPLSVEYLTPERETHSSMPRKYASLISRLSEIAGTRVFSGHELSEIYDWIEVYRFDEETAVLCVKDVISRRGARARLYQMNSEAKLWADNGVVSIEDAEAFIARRDARSAGAQRILSRWQLRRAATDDELSLYAKWTEQWGFAESVVLDACAECTSAQKPSFAYLDTVLETQKLEGALTPEAAAERRRELDATAELARLLLARCGIKRAPARSQITEVSVWRGGFRMDAELLFLAADASFGMTHPWANLKKLVEAWHKDGVSTLAAAKEYINGGKGESQKGPGPRARKNRATDHSQRKYSDEELSRMGINLLDD